MGPPLDFCVYTMYTYSVYKEKMKMIKHLTVHGNSSALIIEKPILELLNINLDTALEVSTDGRNLSVSPVQDQTREKRVKAALDKINKNHGKTLKALAK